MYITICGAPGSGKSTLLTGLAKKLEEGFPTLFKEPNSSLVLLDNIQNSIRDRNLGSLVDEQLALESSVMDLERRNRRSWKITTSSLISRSTFSRIHSLNLEYFYSAIWQKVVDQYDLVLYLPYHGEDGLSLTYDQTLRRLIREFKVPVQLVKGSIENQIDLSFEAVRLKVS